MCWRAACPTQRNRPPPRPSANAWKSHGARTGSPTRARRIRALRSLLLLCVVLYAVGCGLAIRAGRRREDPEYMEGGRPMPAAKAARKLAKRQMTRATLNLRNTLDFSHANVEQRRASGQRRPPARSEVSREADAAARAAMGWQPDEDKPAKAPRNDLKQRAPTAAAGRASERVSSASGREKQKGGEYNWALQAETAPNVDDARGRSDTLESLPVVDLDTVDLSKSLNMALFDEEPASKRKSARKSVRKSRTTAAAAGAAAAAAGATAASATATQVGGGDDDSSLPPVPEGVPVELVPLEDASSEEDELDDVVPNAPPPDAPPDSPDELPPPTPPRLSDSDAEDDDLPPPPLVDAEPISDDDEFDEQPPPFVPLTQILTEDEIEM